MHIDSGSYPNLRFIATFYQILAVLAGIVAVIVVVLGLMSLDSYGEQGTGIILIVGGLFGGAFTIITCLGLAEAIKVFLDIEEHTREIESKIGTQGSLNRSLDSLCRSQEESLKSLEYIARQLYYQNNPEALLDEQERERVQLAEGKAAAAKARQGLTEEEAQILDEYEADFGIGDYPNKT